MPTYDTSFQEFEALEFAASYGFPLLAISADARRLSVEYSTISKGFGRIVDARTRGIVSRPSNTLIRMVSTTPLLGQLIFGNDTRGRVGLQRTMIASCVYCGFLILQWGAVSIGMAYATDAYWITAFCCAGELTFLVTIRCGLSSRFADAAMTMPQMVFAILSIALGYHFNPMIRGGLTTIVPLVLVFGAFILSARQCVQLGWFATAVFLVTMAYGSASRPEVFPPLAEANVFGIIALVLPTVAYLAGQLSRLRSDLKEQRTQLREALEKLRHLATHDPLTGLPNRRHVDDSMVNEIARLRQRGEPLSLAIMDLDRFKRINDTFGHAAGDEVLRVFARETTKLLRDGHTLARWGGEEFLLIMPNTNIEEAGVILKRIRTRVALDSSWAAFPQSRVTFSAGLTVLAPDQTLQQALQCADFALYEAKSAGRDRVAIGVSDSVTGVLEDRTSNSPSSTSRKSRSELDATRI